MRKMRLALEAECCIFEEMLDPENIRKADNRTKITDLFLVVGTSGVVYPAAAYAQVAKIFGARVMEFNLEPTPSSPYCDDSILGKCGETLPKAISEMTGGAVTIE